MTEKRSDQRPGGTIVVRLLLAFFLVSLLPIGTLAILSLQEGGHAEAPPAESAAPADQTGPADLTGPAGETGPAGGTESGGEAAVVDGVPIAMIELGVAGASVVASILAAFYVGRTIVRPVRRLETAMQRVESGDLDATAPVGSHDELGRLSVAFNRMVDAVRRESLIRELFGQYVSPEVARLAIEQEGHLEGQVVHCTVLFVDIRRFTALAEVLPPDRLIGTLNRYFERMLPAVEAEGGMVNKFGGDSLLAVFGSPLNPADDHPIRAVRAALRMREALAAFNREQVAAELPVLHAGFGLATGDVVAGNIGSQRKLEYTVIGDAVNLAARLQELTTELGADILISPGTARECQAVVRVRSVGEISVRGRAEPVEVFAAEGLLADAPAAADVITVDTAVSPSTAS